MYSRSLLIFATIILFVAQLADATYYGGYKLVLLVSLCASDFLFYIDGMVRHVAPVHEFVIHRQKSQTELT